MKLAMIMSASRDDRMVIDVEAYSRAVDLLQRTEVLMTHTFSGYGFGINVYLQQRVMDYISHVKTTKRSTLLQIFYPDIHDIKQFDGILDMLRQMGFCKMKTDGRTGEVYLKYNEGWKND